MDNVIIGILSVLLPPILIFLISKIDEDSVDSEGEGFWIVAFIPPPNFLLLGVCIFNILIPRIIKECTKELLFKLLYFLPVLALGLLWIM